MPEPVNNNQENNQNNGGNGKGSGTDPNNNENTKPFDPKALGDEDIAKIFEDPRVWKHPRFKELNEDAKYGKEAKQREAEAEETRLKEQKKFEELANKNKSKADEAEARYKKAVVDNKIQLEASKLGVVDLEAVLALVDRSKVVVADDGSITGVDEAVKALIEAKPYLKSGQNNNVNIGSGVNPDDNNAGAKKFTLSQVQNPTFYREHEKEILAAMKTPGAIIDDVTPRG